MGYLLKSAGKGFLSVALIGVLLTPSFSCKKETQIETVDNNGDGDRVAMVESEDKAMNEGIAKAKSSVTTFISALKSPKAAQTDFAIKKPYSDNGQTEHFWIGELTYDGTNFHGVINNEPELVKNVRFGQKVVVSPTEISDWMFVENKKLVGGETIRVLRNQCKTAKQRADFDKDLPFVID